MNSPNQFGNLKYDIDAENMTLTDHDVTHIVDELGSLTEIVSEFPVAVLHINFQHYQKSQQYRCKLALVLPDRPFATGDVGQEWQPIYSHCIRKMLTRVKKYKSALERTPELGHHRAHTDREIVATQNPDAELIRETVQTGNYHNFRIATFPYEEDVRNRVGRWVQRFPSINSLIGSEIEVSDIVEEVFLNAFSRFDERPDNVRFGEWLEQLIDPSVQLIASNPDETQQEISFARTIRETDLSE